MLIATNVKTMNTIWIRRLPRVIMHIGGAMGLGRVWQQEIDLRDRDVSSGSAGLFVLREHRQVMMGVLMC
jgi:hypothetical protein